eukprot:scaffold49249_cov55-Phaeocystis_antarctica.AAC.1
MSQAPTVPFAAVASAQELELLAEVSVGGGNASEIARRILRRLPAEPGRRSYAVCHHTGLARTPDEPTSRATAAHTPTRHSAPEPPGRSATHTLAPASSHPCASARLVWQYENGSSPKPNPSPSPHPHQYENGFSFHFLTEGRLIFLCMERGVPPPKAFAFAD